MRVLPALLPLAMGAPVAACARQNALPYEQPHAWQFPAALWGLGAAGFGIAALGCCIYFEADIDREKVGIGSIAIGIALILIAAVWL